MSDDAYSDEDYYDEEYYYVEEGPATEAVRFCLPASLYPLRPHQVSEVDLAYVYYRMISQSTPCPHRS